MFIKDGIIYDTIYGCRKQYRGANIMWLLSLLSFTDRVIIDRIINSPCHGRIKIYVINGDDKT